jgi:hypothetical protein
MIDGINEIKIIQAETLELKAEEFALLGEPGKALALQLEAEELYSSIEY